MERIDVAVIGAGVTGLASALALAESGRSVCLLERHPRAGLDTSTHNSGVIHAGMYYPIGSLKARLCVEGRHLLYEFCRHHDVPHAKCGKLIVANDAEERASLEDLKVRGDANGVEGLTLVDRPFIAAREPAVSASAALWSPETGVVDADALVRALLRAGADAGAIFLPGSQLVGADRRADGIELRTERETIHAGTVVNAAGLYADEVSRMLGGETFTIYPCRGEYVELTPSKRALVRGLVYPLPGRHSLGVHLVKTTARRRLDRADGALSGSEGRLRGESSARSRRSSNRSADCSRESRSTICGSAAAAFVPRSIHRTRPSPIS